MKCFLRACVGQGEGVGASCGARSAEPTLVLNLILIG